MENDVQDVTSHDYLYEPTINGEQLEGNNTIKQHCILT